MRSFALLTCAAVLSLASLTGCAETTPKQPVTPTGPTPPPTDTAAAKPPTPPPTQATRPTLPPDLRSDPAWAAPKSAPDWATFDKAAPLAPKPKATCNALTATAKVDKALPAPVCSNATELTAELSRVMSSPKAAWNQGLARLEACPAAPAGMIRALRAELAPVECADALTDPLLGSHPTNMEPAVAHQLVGLSYAAKLSRLISAPPEMKGKADRKAVAAYLQGPMKAWFEKEARSIESLSVTVAKSEKSCGQGIAAVQAGVADMRFVDLARKAPIPAEWKADRELSSVYYGALDEVLEPRKARGRDAALFGLDVLAQCGYVQDTRVDEARSLIESLYAGKRMVALSGLVLPPRLTGAPNPLFAVLPPFYADRLVGTPDAAALTAWSIRGMPPAARASMEGRLATAPDVTKMLYARARLASGMLHIRGVDFDRALAATFSDTQPLGFEASLAAVLRRGPASAVELMRAASPAALRWSDTKELDALAAREDPDAPYAEYDAAYLTFVAPPDGSANDPAFFLKLKERFDHVASRAADPELKALANKRSTDMADTAKAAAAPAPK